MISLRPFIAMSIATLTASLSFITRADDPEVLVLESLTDSVTIDVDSVGDSLIMPVDSALILSFDELLKIEQEKLAYPLRIDHSIDVTEQLMPPFFYIPSVYKHYKVGRYVNNNIPLPTPLTEPVKPSMELDRAEWLENAIARHDAMEAFQQQFAATYPWIVRLNIDSLPEPPKEYKVTIDPSTTKVSYQEVTVDLDQANKGVAPLEIKRKNWLHSFQGSLQFSQAYNSPNWYQGGNNNVNLIGDFVWNVKLNPAFYSKILFENTVQYRLALNSAPDDTLRSYSISEDRFQVNTKFGLKATHNWYYSATMQFKTQLLQNHPSNSHSTTVAFLSPGELNIGLGMTYSTNVKKASFNVSIAPLSYNMICYTNTDVTRYPGKKVTSQYGSNMEGKMTWNPFRNISFSSRLYVFTNYEYVQGDWENNLSFTINRYLSTNILVHLRYDSSYPKRDDTNWRKFMLREILSFGFNYRFSTL
ncbi:MAG: DUF3078 domain-containing protein [Bacteroidales bacterium]|nr:DUF3078 domain-containing protein [Bacteroidales bacterium]